jgi:DNA-binding MarR family transcriptional regulator
MTDPAALYRAIEGLQRLAELFAERRRELAREAGLSEGEWRLLEEIDGLRFMPSLFARRSAKSPAAVSRTLRALRDRGQVRAAIAEGDARQRAYRLTPAGRRVLARLRTSRARAIAAIWEPLPRGEIERFGRFAAELAGRLEAYAGRDAPGLSPDARAPRAASARAAATRARPARRGVRRSRAAASARRRRRRQEPAAAPPARRHRRRPRSDSRRAARRSPARRRPRRSRRARGPTPPRPPRAARRPRA